MGDSRAAASKAEGTNQANPQGFAGTVAIRTADGGFLQVGPLTIQVGPLTKLGSLLARPANAQADDITFSEDALLTGTQPLIDRPG